MKKRKMHNVYVNMDNGHADIFIDDERSGEQIIIACFDDLSPELEALLFPKRGRAKSGHWKGQGGDEYLAFAGRGTDYGCRNAIAKLKKKLAYELGRLANIMADKDLTPDG